MGMCLNYVLVANISVRPADILLSVGNSEWKMIASEGKDKYKQYIHITIRQKSSQNCEVAGFYLFVLVEEFIVVWSVSLVSICLYLSEPF